MSNIELELHWIVYPPDYDQDKGNYLDFKYKRAALESFHRLGKGTELWCDPMISTHNCVGTVIDVYWPGIVFIAANKETDER
jgi:hypothetical protein